MFRVAFCKLVDELVHSNPERHPRDRTGSEEVSMTTCSMRGIYSMGIFWSACGTT